MSAQPAAMVLHMEFLLDGCRSLKERRGRMAGLRDRLGRHPQLALCEVPSDDPTRSSWTLFAVAGTERALSSLLSRVEQDLEQRVDAQLLDLYRERI